MVSKGEITTVSDFETMILDFRHKTGEDPASVLNDLLDYIIGFLDPEGKPVSGWRHSKEENLMFYDMMICYFELMEKQLGKLGWFDAFGDLIMSMRKKGGGFEQYFTPTDVCNLMSQSIVTEEIQGTCIISDTSCGSSRNLLAAHAKIIEGKKSVPYLVAEDIDILCCKISAVNLAVHGCLGEVVCHDTLSEPDTLRCGYLINRHISVGDTLDDPNITRSTEPSDFYVCKMNKLNF
jgi:type I restriction enzyme M protein